MKRVFGLLIAILLVQFSTNAQQQNDSIKTALVIVDIQNFYFPGGSLELVNAEQASVAAKEILQSFRDQKQLVVHVRHKSKRGLEIHENVEPLPGEKVITKEEINSFLRTDLLEYLQEHRINRLVVIGMQTQMCLQGAVRAAHDYGFECIVIQDACATRDVKFGNNIAKAEDVQTTVLATLIDGGFSKVIDLKEFNTNLEKYLFQKL